MHGKIDRRVESVQVSRKDAGAGPIKRNRHTQKSIEPKKSVRPKG